MKSARNRIACYFAAPPADPLPLRAEIRALEQLLAAETARAGGDASALTPEVAALLRALVRAHRVRAGADR